MRLGKTYASLIIFFIHLSSIKVEAQVINGVDLLFSENLNLITNKKLGVVCNHTSLLPNDEHLVDALLRQESIKVTAIFTPEHGFNGTAEAGEVVDYNNVLYKEVPIISLYGNNRKPSKDNLKNIDVLLFDIQDVGARFYTYVSTMYYVLEAAGENNIPVIILDRPNPIGGGYVDGPVLDNKFKSFVGIAQIPTTHGMTIGELAKYFIGEKIITTWENVDLNVIRCKNWLREIPDEFYLKWNPPSPNINSLETALVYPGTCLIEGTNISEGRGTKFPFLQIGAPFFIAEDIIKELNQLNNDGAELRPISFVPEDIAGMATNPKFLNHTCYGIKIIITDPGKFEAVKFGVKFLSAIINLYGDKIKFNETSFDRLAGGNILREQLENKVQPELIFTSWKQELNKFNKTRNIYLLY